MKNALCAALVLGVFVVLTSFAVSSPTPARATGPAWTVSQYQLDRAFRQSTTLNPSFGGTFPMTGGAIITQLVARTGTPGITLNITVNGATEAFILGDTSQHVRDFNPPIIVHPGESFSFGSNAVIDLVVGGFYTMPGET